MGGAARAHDHGSRAVVVPFGGMDWSSWSVIFQNLIGDFRQRRTDSDDEGDEAEFWGRGNDSVKARVATGILLVGTVAGIAGLTLLARGLF